MKKTLFFVPVIIVVSFAYFRTSIGEKFTATWCGPCHAADAYLEAHQSEWDPYAVIICYHVFDSGLEIPGAYQRYAYYGSLGYEYNYVPHMFIDGWDDEAGPYEEWISTFVEHSSAGSNIIAYFASITDTLARVGLSCETPSTPMNLKLIAVIIQDGVSYGGDIYNWVAETLLTNPLGMSVSVNYGETTFVDIPINLPIRCSPDMSKIVVYLEDPSTHTIVNGIASPMSPPPPYRLETSASATRKIMKLDSTFTKFVLYLKNKGANADVYTISIIPRAVPSGWTIYFNETGHPMTTFRSVASRQIDSVVIAVNGVLGTDAFFDASVVSGYDLSVTDTVSFSVFSPREWLLVNDSWTTDTTMYVRYLNEIGADFVYWNTGKDGELRNLCGFGFSKIIWFCGSQDQMPMMPAERTALREYLNSEGGKLILSGSWVNSSSFGDFQFYWLTLGASYVGVIENAHDVPIFGTDASFIGYECHLALVETVRAEVVSGRSVYRGVTAMRYNTITGDGAAVVKDSLGYRTILFGFPLEKLTNYPEFQALMNRCIYFLDYGWAEINEPTTLNELSMEISPNPFNFSCEISAPAGSEIEVYDISGKFVEKLLTKTDDVWTPDNSNLIRMFWKPDPSVKSGIYFVKVRTGSKVTIKRAAFIR